MAKITERIAALDNFALEDDQRTLEGPSFSISVDTSPDTNFLERNAFDSKFLNDMYVMSKMKSILERGEYFVNFVYTYRSISKALPQLKSDDPNKNELNIKTFEVLEPEIQKVRDLYTFQNDTIEFLCEQIKYQTSADRKTELIPEGLLWYFIKLFDLLALLDALLNMKACLVTDFSFYKRAFGLIKPNETSQDKLLSKQGLFLAQQNSITMFLKNQLQEIQHFDEIITLAINMCASYIESDRYVLPADKHSFLRVMPYGLYLMDGTEANSINIFKSKKINLKRFSNIFKKYPVVTLYGDMQIKLESFIKTAPNYAKNESSWPSVVDDKMAREYEIIHHLPNIRQQHNEYMGKFHTLINTIKLDEPHFTDIEFCLEVKSVVLDGLFLLSNLVSRILQQSAWKYSKPASSDPLNPAANPAAASDQNASANDASAVENSYDQVVRKNYSKAECFALAEMIGLVKGLANKMIKEDGLLAPYIRSAIYFEIQDLVQETINQMIESATKKKRNIRVDLLQIRNIAVDNFDGSLDENLFSKPKKKVQNDSSIKIRPITPSFSQLEILRTSIYNLFAPRMNGKKPFEKDISKDSMKIIEDFYTNSFYYPYLLDFKSVILSMIDLGDLWYREFYLELTKRIQFPIECSLPWILVDQILESSTFTTSTTNQLYDTSMTEYMLYPLDIYNDAANRALSNLKSQFLYNEIEAEVNLAFDQLIFKLANAIYTTYKTQASSLLLDNQFRNQLEPIVNTKLYPIKDRYHSILSQRHFQLLGKFVDLNHIISQRVNNLLRSNIDNAISRFEAKDLTAIIELDTQLNVIQLTYQLLSKHFKQLDPYESIFNEVNDSSSLISYHSRIAFHIISELASDFLPNFNYTTTTKRFIRAPISFGEQRNRDKEPSQQPHFMYGNRHFTLAYSAYYGNLSKFFGIPHMKALVNIVGNQNVSLIVDECLNHLELKIENILVPYVSELFSAMPPNSRNPMADYKVSGGVGYWSGKLIDIIRYPPLQAEVFQHFKEMGNAITFLQLLDLALEELTVERFTVSTTLYGVKSSNFKNPPPVENSPIYRNIHATTHYLQTNPDESVSQFSVPIVLNTAWNAIQAYKSSSNPSLFKASLDRIYMMIDKVRAEWDQQTPEDGAVIPVECAREFYRLFSALKFIYGTPPERGQGEFDSFDLFGDGFIWAGTSIIHFLGQRKRYLAFDFIDHLIGVSEVYPVDINDKKTMSFLNNAQHIHSLTNYIFQIMETFVPEFAPYVCQLHPPYDDADTTYKITSSVFSGKLNQSSNVHVPPGDSGNIPPPPSNLPPPPPGQ